MKKIEQNENKKTIEETLQAYIDDLYAKGYKSEDITKALDKLRKSLNDEDMKVAKGNVQAKVSDDEYHYKVIRKKDVGELNHPQYVMTDGSLEVFPLVCKVDDLETEILDKTYYLFDDLNEEEQEQYRQYVETIALKYPIVKSGFFGLVRYNSRRRQKGSK